MSFWKQALLSIAILIAAAAAWLMYFPGARDTLAQWTGGAPSTVGATTPSPAAAGDSGIRGGPQGGVVTGEITTATINDRLTAIGTGRANSTVAVRPFTSGRLVEVIVKSGDRVKAGDVLARLDAQGEEIAVDRAGVALDDARATLERIRTLRTANTASAVQLADAQVATRNAELALREAELALERRTIEAPISGVVGILPITAGNYVTNASEVATIDDRSRILVDFWAPERFASQIEVGQPITATSIARPGETFAGTISAVDNRIDPASRTLKVEAQITNPADRLRAGMSFQVTLTFVGETYPAVNPLSVQWGTEGAFVWAVREGLARRVPVSIVQRNTESILVDAEFEPEDLVVVEGLHIVREGAPVMIARMRGRTGQSSVDAPAHTASGT